MLNQLQPILSQTANHKKGRKGKSRPIFVSKKTEVLYLSALNTLIDDIHQTTVDELDKLLKPQIGDSVMVADGLFDRFTSGFANFSKLIKDKVADIAQSIAKRIVGEQKKASDTQLAEMLQRQTGIDLSGLMKDEDLEQAVNEAVGANVALIKSIPEQYLAKVEQAVLSGLQSGTLNKTLADELQKTYGLTRNRAELIASDQLAKINSRLSQIRQQKLGITHYRWRTSRDERVRHSHKLRDGKLFAWDNPPTDGHAGQAIRCRCVAEPYTEHLLGGKSPEDVMKEQELGFGDTRYFDLFDELMNDIDNQNAVADRSNRLLDNVSLGAKRSDLPAYKDKKWGFSHTGLKNSERFFNELIKQGIDPPYTWAVHHWTIDSRYILNLTRKNTSLNDEKVAEFSPIAEQSLNRLNALFALPDAKLDRALAVYRGTAITADKLAEYKKALKNGEIAKIEHLNYQSNSTDLDVAKKFANMNAKNGKIPVIHKTILPKGSKAIDITQYHYYPDENEILLAGGYERVVFAIRNHGEYVEMVSKIQHIGGNAIGDKKAKDMTKAELQAWANSPAYNPDEWEVVKEEVIDYHPTDPREHHWCHESGMVSFLRRKQK